MPTVACEVTKIDTINQSIFKVLLRPIVRITFLPGQYLMVVMGEKDMRPFSIASIPEQSDILALHIATSKYNPYTRAVIEYLQNHPTVNIDMPHGDAWLRQTSSRPLLLIAGGIGYSAIRSILLSALAEPVPREIRLYWGTRESGDLYDLRFLQQLAKRYRNLTVTTIVEYANDSWHGKTGTVVSAVMQDFHSLATYDIYLSGRLEMVKRASNRFCATLNADRTHIYSDAFEFYTTSNLLLGHT